MNTKKTFDNKSSIKSTKIFSNDVINNIVITENEFKKCAVWASSISISELDGGIFSGVKFQKDIGKSEQECARYVYRNFKDELSGIISFNKDMGINF